jgi:MFS family permease
MPGIWSKASKSFQRGLAVSISTTSVQAMKHPAPDQTVSTDSDRKIAPAWHRWACLTAGCLIQIILGGVYAWSTFVPHLQAAHGLTNGQSGAIFGTSILAFTLAMIVAGRVLPAHGPQVTAAIAAALFASGYLLAGASGGSFPVLFIAIALITGAGIGFGYVCPLLPPLPPALVYATVLAVTFCFGANFVHYASAISRFYGMAAFPRLYPLCFLAYGVAGVLGPGLGGAIADHSGSFGLPIVLCLLIAGTVVTAIRLPVFSTTGPTRPGQAPDPARGWIRRPDWRTSLAQETTHAE